MGKKNTRQSSSYEPTGCRSPEGVGLHQESRENLRNFASSAWFLLLSSVVVVVVVVVVVIIIIIIIIKM
jgi:hypothetical protein